MKCQYLIWLLSCKIKTLWQKSNILDLDLNNFIFSGGAPVGDGPVAAKGSPLAVQHEAQKTVPGAAPASSQGQAQLNRSSSVGANQRVGGGWILHNVYHVYMSRLADGPGQAVISEGGAGGRGAGPGEGRVNGMPSKKSNSTSKLSAKGKNITLT